MSEKRRDITCEVRQSMGGGKIVKVDLGICREIDRYTCMYVLEANKVRRGRQGERVWLGGGARGLPCRGGRSVRACD